MKADMTIDGVSFNKEWAKGKTESEFVNEFKEMDHIFPGANQVDRLKAAYAKLNPGLEPLPVIESEVPNKKK